MLFIIFAPFLLFSTESASIVFDPPPSNSTVLEGRTSSFTCAPNGTAFISWAIDPVGSDAVTVSSSNSTNLTGADQVIQSADRTQVTITGVQRSLDGASVRCRAAFGNEEMFSPLVYIVVQRPPNFTLPELSRDVLEGQALNLTLEDVEFGNSEGAVSVLFEGRVLTERDGFTVSRSGSTWSLEFPALNRSDAGVYRVLLNNSVGSSGMNFTVNVVYPPEFNFPTVRSIQLNNGSQFTFDCTASAANPSSVDYSFHKDGSSQPFSESGPVLTISSVARAKTGNYSCTANNTVGSSITVYHNLLVVAPPQYSLKAGQSTAPQALEGSDFTYQFNLDNGGVEPSFTWSRGGTGGVLMNGSNKYILTADSITVKSVDRDDSVTYTVSVTNMAGSHSISFSLDVQYPPEFTIPTVRNVQLNSGSQFTFNCTASAANPSSVDYSFHINSSSQPLNVSGASLTISSVVRANTGNYSCTANNTAGSTTLYYNLLVVAPPTSPLNVMVSGEMAFSAMVTWTQPTDDGGIFHPSWTPPSHSSSPIILYTVAYSNSSGSWNINNLNTPLVTLSNLQHSTNYTVIVAASNAYGQSTGVQGTFRTNNSKPILKAAVLAPLSLNNFTANVTFLTVGGQDVTSFKITINDSSPAVIDSTPVPDGKGVMVPLLIVGRSFTKGAYYTVEITATNSVGTSEPITGLMFVPNPPVITANFTEVSADDIPSNKCCAGVQLRLAEQPDVSNLKVLLTPQGGNQFTVNPADLSLEGFTLYIGGVQAGTNYTAVVTVSTIFGSSDSQLQLKPLLGVPSSPNPPTVSVNGGQVTVELSTAYPGTVQTRSGSMFRFEIQFIEEEQRSTRQSKTEIQAATPASLFNTSAIFTTNLDPASYSVSVTAINEHGRSSAVMSESTFTVTVTPAPEDNVTIIIVIAIVVVVVVVPVLIVLILAIICIICCMRVKKNKKEKYHVGSEDTELTANRNAVEKNSLDGDRDSLFIETGMYDVVGKETIKPPKPQSTPASTTNGQPQPGGDVYAEVNKPKKTNEAAATPTTPPTEDMYEAVDMSKKTKKPKTEAPADKVDPEATLYAEVVQEKKEPAVPPKTEAEYQNPEVDKPIEENELQYATLDFSKAPSSFKKPAPPNPDENVIYSQVTIAKKQ